MVTLREGILEITLPVATKGSKFDDCHHGLSHCMKAVDFIVEEKNRIIFIEIKNPEHPSATIEAKETFFEELCSGKVNDILVQKYRDSFIYLWAEEKLTKPVVYWVLIASKNIDPAMLLHKTEELKRKIPLEGPKSGAWKRQIVVGCAMFNHETWKQHLPKFPVRSVE